jgi:deoxyribodipyrimidine photo-lyase
VCVRGGELADAGGRCVVYRMRRAQRALDNPALECAIAAANALRLPVVIFFALLEPHPVANLRHYQFMLEGLIDTAARLERRGVGFIMRLSEPADSSAEFAKFCIEVKPALVIADEDPARRERARRRDAQCYPRAPLWSVDADVIVPSILFGREHFAARTIRPRIRERLDEFLKPVGNRTPRVRSNPRSKPRVLTPHLGC